MESHGTSTQTGQFVFMVCDDIKDKPSWPVYQTLQIKTLFSNHQQNLNPPTIDKAKQNRRRLQHSC